MEDEYISVQEAADRVGVLYGSIKYYIKRYKDQIRTAKRRELGKREYLVISYSDLMSVIGLNKGQNND